MHLVRPPTKREWQKVMRAAELERTQHRRTYDGVTASLDLRVFTYDLKWGSIIGGTYDDDERTGLFTVLHDDGTQADFTGPQMCTKPPRAAVPVGSQQDGSQQYPSDPQAPWPFIASFAVFVTVLLGVALPVGWGLEYLQERFKDECPQRAVSSYPLDHPCHSRNR